MKDSKAQPPTASRRFVDRMGQVITRPDGIESRRLIMLLRRLNTIHAKAGRVWPETVMVGELAKSAKVSVDRIIDWADGEAYLVGHIALPRSSKETWWVYEDGE